MASSRKDQANIGRRTAPSGNASHKRTDFPIVGIGASAGGPEACTKLLDALPASTGMAFVLVRHLEPTHESMMVELLADQAAGDRRGAGRTQPPSCHSARGLPFGRRRRPAQRCCTGRAGGVGGWLTVGGSLLL